VQLEVAGAGGQDGLADVGQGVVEIGLVAVAGFQRQGNAAPPGLGGHVTQHLDHRPALPGGGRRAGQCAQRVGDAAAQVVAADGLGLGQRPVQEGAGLLRLGRHVRVSGQHQRAGAGDPGPVKRRAVGGGVEVIGVEQGDFDQIEADPARLGNGVVARLGRPLPDPDKRMSAKLDHRVTLS